MLADLAGSYEESPPSLIDLSARDRRWCQGNLQHTRVIGAKGLKLPTRQHFATGIMSYLASPFWLFQLIVGIALVLQTTYIRPEYFARDFRLFPVWPRFDPERALALFAVTMGILLAPKLFGLILMLVRTRGPPRLRRRDPARDLGRDRDRPLGAAGPDPDADPVGLRVPDPARARHRLAAAAARRRLDPVPRHRAAASLAHGAWRACGHLRLPHRHVALPMDVADDRRPPARHPAVLAQRASSPSASR